jgi:4-amino-4-deoxy-L-arabinose transferase-like glycosyltransferase
MLSFCAMLARTRLTAWALVVLVWACLFLPYLGAPELQGNEPKRVLPALQMLRTGNWFTPQLGGIKYLNKPPLIYWSVAGAFALTGQTGEGVARVPSVLMILLFVTLLVWQPSRWLPLTARLCAALLFLTIVSFVEKGRQIEIEAAFVSVTGIALLWWLNAWTASKSGWALWLAPCLMVALGLLLKGPLILLFFYVPVVCVAVAARRLRSVVAWQHGVGLLLMLLPLLAWVGAALTGNPDMHLARVWESEMGSRYAVQSLDIAGWIGGIAKSFVDFLPWTFLLPMVWWPNALRRMPESQRRFTKALRMAVVLCFVAISSMPGVRARYYMPLFPLLCLLIAMTLEQWESRESVRVAWRRLVLGACAIVAGVALVAALLVPTGGLVALLQRLHITLLPEVVRGLHTWHWPLVSVCLALGVCGGIYRARRRLVSAQDLAVATALLVTAVGLGVITYGVPCKRHFEDRRPAGAALNAAIRTNAVMYVYRVGYQPYYYYVARPIAYVWKRAELSPAMHTIFTHQVFVPEITNQLALTPATCALTPLPYRREPYVLLHLRPSPAAAPPKVMP